LPFADQPGLRPTPDRLRETLFNWLQPVITGARCLDLFAGSGALGFEAASRSASRVVLVERERATCKLLNENVELLNAAGVEVHQSEAMAYLGRCKAPFDGIFVDPPYATALGAQVLARVDAEQLLKPGGWLYLEQSANAEAVALPDGWRQHRQARAGDALGTLLHAPAWSKPESAC
jgi:16S rRNA (guanine966-N2)-methyltransferase